MLVASVYEDYRNIGVSEENKDDAGVEVVTMDGP
jgi:hypothetical protein